MQHLDAADWIALSLVVIGGINWGLVGALNIDLISLLFGTMTITARIIYGVVGLAALYTMFTLSTKTA